MSLQKHISIHAHQLTDMEKELLANLLEKRETIQYEDFTIAKMAELFSVSQTSAHRLTQKLGYKSFTYFRDDFIIKDEPQQVTRTTNNDNYIEMLIQTYEAVKNADMTSIIQQMVAAKKVTIYGMGMSNFLGKMFQIKLQLGGKQTEQFDDSRFMRVSARYLTKDEDILFVLSRSGNPPELIEAVVEASTRKVMIVLITEQTNSPLASLATHVIYTAHSIDTDRIIDTRLNAHIAMDYIVNLYLETTEKGRI